MHSVQLAALINMASPPAVLGECQQLLGPYLTHAENEATELAFAMNQRLYEGLYPGYQACNTRYHDYRHTTDTFLALARIIHGAMLNRHVFSGDEIQLALTAALFHDAGFIQEIGDLQGTGAKYTATHVRRSCEFVARYGRDNGLAPAEIRAAQTMINYTDLALPPDDIISPSPNIALLGQMLGAADLLAQMADRIYLEKLLFLYYEFAESKVGHYEDEIDLLRQTLDFFDHALARIDRLTKAQVYLRSHFLERWNLPVDLYHVTINRHRAYLAKILDDPSGDPRRYLRRHGIVDRVREMYGGIGRRAV